MFAKGFILPLVVVLSGVRALASSNVLVVAPSGAPYTQIQPAIDAAQDGDIVLVKAGNYDGIAVTDKSIAVVADEPGTIQLNGNATVNNLAASRDVLLHRLSMNADPNGGEALVIEHCTGSVRVQSCDMHGTGGAAALSIAQSQDVALNDCRATGSNGVPIGWTNLLDAGAGARIGQSIVAMHGCGMRGGNGAPSSCGGGSGGDGLDLFGSYGYAADCSFYGGNGASAGLGSGSSYPDGGNGGHGVRLKIGSLRPSPFDFIDAAFSGGTPGFGSYAFDCECGFTAYCQGEGGNLGLGIYDGGVRTFQAFVGVPPLLQVNHNPIREQSQVQLAFFGQPGDLVVLLSDTETSFTPTHTATGVYLVPRNAQPWTRIIGTIGPSGVISVHWTLPDLGTGVQGQVVHFQAAHANTFGRVHTSNPVHLVELDQAF
jgi:hypothetical protein